MAAVQLSDSKKGTMGEMLVIAALERAGKEVDLIFSLAEQKRYGDFRIKGKSYEVKTYDGDSDNVFVDICYLYPDGSVKPGWISNLDRCDWFVHVHMRRGNFYVIRMEHLRRLVAEKAGGPWRITHTDRDASKTTVGCLIPLQDLLQHGAKDYSLDDMKPVQHRDENGL